MSVQSTLRAVAATLAAVSKAPEASLIGAVADLLEGREARDVEVLLQTLTLNRIGHVDTETIDAEVTAALRAKFGGVVAGHISRLAKAHSLPWVRKHLESVT